MRSLVVNTTTLKHEILTLDHIAASAAWVVAFMAEKPALFTAAAAENEDFSGWATDLREQLDALGWLDMYRTEAGTLTAW